MKIKPYIDRLNKSKEYKSFQKKYDDAFMVAGFFIMDLEAGKNMHQIDYYIPSQKKIAAFTLDGGVTVQILDTMNSTVPEKLDMNNKIDLEAIPGILEDEMKNRNITEEIKKIIAIVQTIDGKKVWNLNCVLSGMEILKAHIDDDSKTILKMEKASIMDYVKKMPLAELKKMQKMQKGAAKEGEEKEDEDEDNEEESKENGSPEELKLKLKKLKELETAIEKEEEETEQELEKDKAVKAIKKEKAESEKKVKKKK